MTTIDEARAIGKSLDGATEGFTKKGTIHERRTFNVEGRTFLTLGKTDARVKLESSLPFAKKLASKEPDVCAIESGGWVTVTLEDAELELVQAWIEESYALVAGRPITGSRKPRSRGSRTR